MLAGVEFWDWALAVIFIAVTVDDDVAVADGGCIDNNVDDNVVGIGPGGDFVV